MIPVCRVLEAKSGILVSLFKLCLLVTSLRKLDLYSREDMTSSRNLRFNIGFIHYEVIPNIFFLFIKYQLRIIVIFCLQLNRSRTILLETLRKCIVTFPRDLGLSLIKIMDGKFLIALPKA